MSQAKYEQIVKMLVMRLDLEDFAARCLSLHQSLKECSNFLIECAVLRLLNVNSSPQAHPISQNILQLLEIYYANDRTKFAKDVASVYEKCLKFTDTYRQVYAFTDDPEAAVLPDISPNEETAVLIISDAPHK